MTSKSVLLIIGLTFLTFANTLFHDFTGDAYRLVLEIGFDSLGDYETSLTSELNAAEWKAWYEQFKPLVERSHREILKQVM